MHVVSVVAAAAAQRDAAQLVVEVEEVVAVGGALGLAQVHVDDVQRQLLGRVRVHCGGALALVVEVAGVVGRHEEATVGGQLVGRADVGHGVGWGRGEEVVG